MQEQCDYAADWKRQYLKADLIDALKDPSGTAIGGGSVPGGMDHLAPQDGFGQRCERDCHDAGGTLAALLSGEILPPTGFSEAVACCGEENSGCDLGARVDALSTMKERRIELIAIGADGPMPSGLAVCIMTKMDRSCAAAMEYS